MVEARVVPFVSKGNFLCSFFSHQLWTVPISGETTFCYLNVSSSLTNPVSFLQKHKGFISMFMCAVHASLHLCGYTCVCKYKYICIYVHVETRSQHWISSPIFLHPVFYLFIFVCFGIFFSRFFLLYK